MRHAFLHQCHTEIPFTFWTNPCRMYSIRYTLCHTKILLKTAMILTCIKLLPKTAMIIIHHVLSLFVWNTYLVPTTYTSRFGSSITCQWELHSWCLMITWFPHIVIVQYHNTSQTPLEQCRDILHSAIILKQPPPNANTVYESSIMCQDWINISGDVHKTQRRLTHGATLQLRYVRDW